MQEKNKAVKKGNSKYVTGKSDKNNNAINQIPKTYAKRKLKVVREFNKSIETADVDNNVGIRSVTGTYRAVGKARDFSAMAKLLKKKKPVNTKHVYNTRQQETFSETKKATDSTTEGFGFGSSGDKYSSVVISKKKNNVLSKNKLTENRSNNSPYIDNNYVIKGNRQFQESTSINAAKVKSKTSKTVNSHAFGSAVSKITENTIMQINKANTDDNVGIKGSTDSIVGAKKVYQTGRQSFSGIQKAFTRRKAQQEIVKQQMASTAKKAMASAAKQATAKATASIASTSAPVLIVLIMSFLMFFLIVAIIVPTSYHHLSSYPGTDEEVSESNQNLTSKAQELRKSVEEVEENPAYSHINEFRYNPSRETILDSFDYDPFILLAYLSAKYQEYNMEDVRPEIDIIMQLMFNLTFTEIQETRYDSDNDPYPWYVLKITLVKTDLEEIVMARMNEEEKELYKLYLEETGDLKSGIYNPFDIDWYPFITCKMGWREDPFGTGGGDNHTGMDISWGGIAGTSLKAGLTGTVTKITYESGGGSYGNRVEISSPNNEVTVLYAHMTNIHVALGDPVMAGVTTVGTVGSTGWSTGAHLHIEVFKSGQRIDPILVLSRDSRE